jgi:hypothetical protein
MATWIKLRELATAQPGTASAAMLKKVVATLEGDAGFGLWKGYDEPWWSGIQPSQLQYAYCMATSRGSLSWCGPDSPLDSNHVFVTIEAPRGTASDLQPYSAVTDSHGVDIYPVTYGVDNPNLHQVGTWTQTMSSITPNHVVWTTLQICDSGSIPNDGSDGYVLPTRLQERYMIYDAIINGARALAFFGGQVNYCWTSTDSSLGWNWTFWNSVLKSLIQEINAGSPLAPALLNAGSTQTLQSSDATTDVIPPDPAHDHIHLLLRPVRVAVRKAIAGRDALVAQRAFLELERLGRCAELEVRSAVELSAEVLQIVLDVPECERHGGILWRHPKHRPSRDFSRVVGCGRDGAL